MSMVRSVALCLVVLIVVLALMPISLSAEQATPTPNAQRASNGYVASGSRTFRSAGPRAYGVNSILFNVYVCHSAYSAQQVMQQIVVNIPNLELPADTGDFQQASISDLGDEAQAYLALTEPGEFQGYYGIVVWRDGENVYVGFAFSVGRDPFQELFSIGRTITGRQYRDTPTLTPVSGIGPRTGGVWDLLPTLSDFPEGFVFVVDEDSALTEKATPTP